MGNGSQLFIQVIIALITTTIGSVLTYFKALRESDVKIETIKIKTENEIQKIKEESNKEIEKIKTEYEEQRKMMKQESKINYNDKENDIKMKYTDTLIAQMIDDPDTFIKNIKGIQKVANKFSNNGKKRK